MKNKKFIYALIITIGIIGVAGFIILGSVGGRNKKPSEPIATPESEMTVQNPAETDNPEITPPETDEPPATEEPTPFDPEDPVGNGDIAPDEIPDEDNDIKVNAGETETGRIDGSEVPSVTPEIKTVQGEKRQDESKSAEVENEIINDNELEKKDEAEKKKEQEAEKDDKPTTVVGSESTIGNEEDKPVSVIEDTEEKNEETNADENAPVYVNPAQGGSNPFESGGDSKIDDHNSDEFIGDDGDRPGEGIHF